MGISNQGGRDYSGLSSAWCELLDALASSEVIFTIASGEFCLD